MKELLILAFGAAQSLLIWTILRLRDKVNTLNKENNELAELMFKWAKGEKQ